MNRSTTVRCAALIASAFITFTTVALIADYSYPAHGVHLASSGMAKRPGKVVAGGVSL